MICLQHLLYGNMFLSCLMTYFCVCLIIVSMARYSQRLEGNSGPMELYFLVRNFCISDVYIYTLRVSLYYQLMIFFFYFISLLSHIALATSLILYPFLRSTHRLACSWSFMMHICPCLHAQILWKKVCSFLVFQYFINHSTDWLFWVRYLAKSKLM